MSRGEGGVEAFHFESWLAATPEPVTVESVHDGLGVRRGLGPVTRARIVDLLKASGRVLRTEMRDGRAVEVWVAPSGPASAGTMDRQQPATDAQAGDGSMIGWRGRGGHRFMRGYRLVRRR